MIYFCADDYGLCDSANIHIQQCIEEGVLNKVSVFPNLGKVDLSKLSDNNSVRLSLHLNLVEGKCMAKADEVSLIAHKNGNFKYTFGGLFKLCLFHRKELEAQLYKEIKAQVLFWKNILPESVPFCVDSHQHTHMIPAVFKALVKVLDDEKIALEYIRIPSEPLVPFIKKPSLYFTYNMVNIIKQWLLKLLWLCNQKYVKKNKIPTANFFGILFSGKMDENRVKKLLPGYIKRAQKNGMDIEILFHPGYIEKNEIDFKNNNIVFEKFYLSDNRKTEFDSVIKLSERSVL
ncbi:MAG: ChbG/HpnK family deacetylase [Clostridia bacterium]|nr:ChbG/HpnK family deacetylase [Clostridia bacterium]